MKNLFEVKNLCYAYLKKPLCIKDANFSASKNDKILILGLDDKGKTTLLKTMSAFEERYFGEAYFNGIELRKIHPKDRNFSLIFDYTTLLNDTIDANLKYLYDVIGKEMPVIEERVKLLSLFGLNYKLNDKVKKLSIFEKFKLCLLRAYIKNSNIVFIDDILKNEFTEDEANKLFDCIEMISKDHILFLCANDESFRTYKTVFEKFKWSKVLYINNAKLSEKQNITSFIDDPVDLDVLSFSDDYEKVDAYCIYQDGEYFISIDEKFIIKVDKELCSNFDELKLANLENEDIIIAYKKDLEVDFSKNNDINKLMKKKDLLIFSKIDRSRIN